jgi:hypothetical protein
MTTHCAVLLTFHVQTPVCYPGMNSESEVQSSLRHIYVFRVAQLWRTSARHAEQRVPKWT